MLRLHLNERAALLVCWFVYSRVDLLRDKGDEEDDFQPAAAPRLIVELAAPTFSNASREGFTPRQPALTGKGGE
jgi:hypothetical protein